MKRYAGNAIKISLAIAALVGFSSSSNAVVMSVNSAFGNNTLTRDSSSGLDWLDISFTDNLTLNQALALTAPGAQFEGFRLARVSEWQSFTSEMTTQFGSNSNAAFGAIGFIGCSSCNPPTTFRLDGYLQNTSSYIFGLALAQRFGINPDTYVGTMTTQSASIDPNRNGFGEGAFLVSTSGSTPNNPWLPPANVSGPPFQVQLPVFRGIRTFVDPIYAVGYDYSIGSSSPLVSSIFVPGPLKNGDSQFILTFGGNSFALDAGVEFDVLQINPLGISSFQIKGISPFEQIDPNDPLGFVLGLEFATSGLVDLTINPLKFDTSAPVPEPSSWSMMIGGFTLVGHALRRRKRVAISLR